MARYNKLGFVPCQVIAEDYALPNATNAALTNTVQLPAVGTGMLKVIICSSSTTTELASAATLRITPLFGATATTCVNRCMGTIELIEGDITLNNTAGSATTKDFPDNSTWAAGAHMVSFYIDPRLAKAYPYMDINVATSADERADSIEAYLVVE
jgi:hypothetical protein